MAVLNGKLTPDGVLSLNQAGPGPSNNSVNVGRQYDMLEVSVLVQSGTPTATVFLQRRGELWAGGTRTADTGAFVNVTDAGNPAAGMGLTAAIPSGTFRVAQPKGEYQLNVTALGAGAALTASYSLSGETR